MLKQMFAVCLIFALCVFQSTDAIRCYQCKSLTDANCAKDKIDQNSNIRQVDCNNVPKPNTNDQYNPVTKCNKVITKDAAGTIVSRDCHFEVVGQKADQCSVSHSQAIESCSTCTGDLCNASSAGRFIAMGFAAMMGVAAMLFVF